MKIDSSRIGRLANLTLTKDEIKKLNQELGETVAHIERLKEVDTSGTLETNEVNNLKNVYREDKALRSLTQKEALMNSKSVYKGYFLVERIIEEL